MRKLALLFEYSPWLIACCILLGLIYSFLLYQKKGVWNKNTNYALAFLRFLLVTVLAILLLGPFVNYIRNTIEKPVFLIAVDNSSSVRELTDSLFIQELREHLKDLGEQLVVKGYSLAYKTLDEKEVITAVDSIQFDMNSTNLDGLLGRIRTEYEGRNLRGTILFSDGIYNQGLSPAFSKRDYPLYTVGIGDTLPRADINLKALYFNKIVYQGNQFPIVAELGNTGMLGVEAEVRVKKDGKILQQKRLSFTRNNDIQQLEFLLEADEQGMQHYIVEVIPVEGELTVNNNIKHAFIDVVEGKENILLVAPSPHPDIKAIKSAIEKNKNYHFEYYISSVHQAESLMQILRNKKYDLIILHQLPGDKNTNKDIFEFISTENIPSWYIIGSQSSIVALNGLNTGLNIQAKGNRTDQVLPYFNPSFSTFKIDDLYQSRFQEFTPVTVPFGDFAMATGTDILLYQQVGSVKTKKPLLTLYKPLKSAVMLGEGLWQWRLQEYARYGDQKAFDDVILKLVQFLSNKEDKRKFNAYPVNSTYYDTDLIIFETEVYNDLYEETYGHKVNLQLKDEADSLLNFSYVTSEYNTRYQIGNLPEGVYHYEASARVDGEERFSKGTFAIEALTIESLNLTADHNLLKDIARQSGGAFFHVKNLDQLTGSLLAQETRDVIHTHEDYLPAVHIKELFFLLLVLITTEWFIRKFSGAY